MNKITEKTDHQPLSSSLPLLSFQDLAPEWQDALAQEGIVEASPIQAQTFYPIQDGRDILAQSMTGSGKTIAFSLPLAIKKNKAAAAPSSRQNGPSILILTPTRELADQVAKVFTQTLRLCRLSVTTIIGGVSYSKQEKAIQSGVDVIVGTPGRIADLLEKRMLSLAHLEHFVLDEVDQMLDIGFAKELNLIRSHITKKAQTLFFSATLNRDAVSLANKLLDNPVHVSIAAANTPCSIEHGFLTVKANSKLKALVSCLVYFNPSQAIIFCETKKECSDVTHCLNMRGFSVSQLNSDLNQYERQVAMAKFKKGSLQFLVATNVAARGIDVQGLPLVINFTPPRDIESYTHRVGRTGRAGAKGKAWTFITPEESFRYHRLVKQIRANSEKISLPDSDAFVQTLVHRELGQLSQVDEAAVNPHGDSMDLSSIDQALGKLSATEIRSLLKGVLTARLQKIGISNPELLQWQESALRDVERQPRFANPLAARRSRFGNGPRYGSQGGNGSNGSGHFARKSSAGGRFQPSFHKDKPRKKA